MPQMPQLRRHDYWTCPDCTGDLINGQGLRACLDPECGWAER